MSRTFLLVNSSFYPNSGGVENSLRSMATVLVNQGHHVIIVCNDVDNSSPQRLPKQENLFGAQVIRYSHKRGAKQVYAATSLLRDIRSTYQITDVICRSWQLLLCLFFAGYKQPVYVAPAVYANQNHPDFNAQKSLKYKVKYAINSWMESLAFKFPRRIVVFSETMRRQVTDVNHKSKIEKIPPGVDPKRFYPVIRDEKIELKKQLGLPESQQIILCLGRFEKVKGFDKAIEAMKFMGPDIHLVLVGDGSQKDVLMRQIEMLDLQGRVTIHPATREPEIYYRAADLFMFTSLYEPFGQVLLEAAASGLLIIGFSPSAITKVDTASEEIFAKHRQLIYLAEQFNAEALANQAELAFKERSEHPSVVDETTADFSQQHSWEACVKRLIQ